MIGLKWANLTAAFALELGLLAALAYWGYRVGAGTGAKLGLALGAPLLMALAWGTFMAPKALIHPPGWLHTPLALALFGLGVAALYAAGRPGLAAAFAVAVLINRLLLIALGGQPD